jgi:hypothetical protein
MATHEEGSTRSEREAGWRCREPGRYRALLEEAYSVPAETGKPKAGPIRQFRWSMATGRQARNEKLAKLKDPSNDQRRAWLADGPRDLLVRTELSREEVSFLVLGDPGEGDASQFAVVPPLLCVGADTDFMLIASDVVYPAGDANDYPRKLYFPYRDYRKPIYAVPGNHDWDDGGLYGFMFHFCDREDVPAGVLDAVPSALRPFWRRPTPPDEVARDARDARRREVPQPTQPGPYFALDAGPVLVLGLDVGIRGSVDRDQAQWFRETARGDPRPKIVVGGKTIWFEGRYEPPVLEDGGSADELIREPDHGVIAYLSGEIHNYQRYPVAVPGARKIQYIVCGGGGAFTQGTHTVARIETPNPTVGLPPILERDVRLYPLRADSLSFFSELYATKLGELARRPAVRRIDELFARRVLPAPEELWIRPAAAERIVSEWTGIPPERESVEPTRAERRAANVVRWLPNGHFSELYYPFWDWDRPPFFKSFLRVDATEAEVAIRCYAATGCGEHDDDPPLEDEVRWTRADGWVAPEAASKSGKPRAL